MKVERIDFENPEEMRQVFRIYRLYVERVNSEFPLGELPIPREWFLPFIVGHNMAMDHLRKDMAFYKVSVNDEVISVACVMPYPLKDKIIPSIHLITKTLGDFERIAPLVKKKAEQELKRKFCFILIKDEKLDLELEKRGWKRIAQDDYYVFLKG